MINEVFVMLYYTEISSVRFLSTILPVNYVFYELQLMAEKLRYAIFNCTEMDADFRTNDADVAGWGAPMAAAAPSSWQDGSF